MSVIEGKYPAKQEEDESKPSFPEFENNDQYMIQKRLPMRPNICVICLTCLTCSGKYGSELCTCEPTEIQWNIKKIGYKVDFRRKSVSSSNEAFLTWLRANRSARLMWSERYKEVKICTGCNSACWRWMKMYKGNETSGQNPSQEPAGVSSRAAAPFSPKLGTSEDEKPPQEHVNIPESSPISPKSPQRPRPEVKTELTPNQPQVPTTFTSPISPLNTVLRATHSPPIQSTKTPPRPADDPPHLAAKRSRKEHPPYIREREREKVEEAPLGPSILLKTVTVRSRKKIYKEKIAISPTTTFESVLKYAIPISPPEGKRFVMKDIDKQIEYVPDDFIAEAIPGVEHIDIYVYIEKIPDVQLDDFEDL
ncbi:hypothetical protein K493DRAFT_350079 [Basidiobolus meristosporus CBS 931.73]|uniref:Uncharacterized protein n=1 Tax=Basidiobolus meristosporus CBS 931.73 TaxID=1314790 RepID=A0A1Y1YHR4_9FUNG|nr:hypothetical protein K493DRAFT_350079 [Basidiobolus meristosporus CBS 931.73]|eukprot:ORX97423.1 hypothetical protein K493DRAFT_350079 [Basidiobolus meristosporus CBS 931.73]